MAENEMLTDVPLTQIRDFLHHPYLVKDDESMDELVESIKERGLIQPVIIRPVENGMYEMVSGHRRKRAFEVAGYEKIPARVKEMSRDEAILSMVDSNLQRETVLPSEKARTYKMLRHIKDGIDKIKSQYPYTVKDIVEDPKKEQERKQELEEILAYYKEIIKIYKNGLEEMLR